MKLEEFQTKTALCCIFSDELITVVSVQWFGIKELVLTYNTPTRKVANKSLYRHDESRLETTEVGPPWSFKGDGALFRLVSEYLRFRRAHLLVPILVGYTSVVEPLPRQALRCQISDDPRTGKIIMVKLPIKELIARDDLQLCLVVCLWNRADQLKLQKQAGNTSARLNSSEAGKCEDSFLAQPQKCLGLKLEALISPLPHMVLGRVLVLTQGLVKLLEGNKSASVDSTVSPQASATRGLEITMETKQEFGFDLTEREFENLGYDIESQKPDTDRFRCIEVKGRISSAPAPTAARNEILYTLNKPEDYIIGIVKSPDSNKRRVHYDCALYQREPDFGVTSVIYNFDDLLARAEVPL